MFCEGVRREHINNGGIMYMQKERKSEAIMVLVLKERTESECFNNDQKQSLGNTGMENQTVNAGNVQMSGLKYFGDIFRIFISV